MVDGHSNAENNNYTVTFHPAFASRCVVTGPDGECEVYKQSEPHRLNGQPHPQKHTIRLRGGPFNRDITLEVHDPHHAIKQVRLELYGQRDATLLGATAQTFDTVEVFETDNHAETCPPTC
ncbi:MAG TPA: hypothetical protein VF541_17415 [Longimicrobium sp.]|jgi:hypothetical protein